jgi:hypothetical protein
MGFISKIELKKQLKEMGIKVEGNYVRKKGIKKVLGGSADDIAILKKAMLIKNRYAWTDVLAWLNDNDIEYDGWDDLNMLSFYLAHKDLDSQ